MLLHDAAKAQRKSEARSFKYEGGKAGGMLHDNWAGEGILKHLSFCIRFIQSMPQAKKKRQQTNMMSKDKYSCSLL